MQFIRRAQQCLAVAVIDDAAAAQDIGAISDAERKGGELLDQKYGKTGVSQLAHCRHQPRDDDRGQARRHFVDHQHFRPGQKCSRNDQHLLFTTREQAGTNGTTLQQLRKQAVGFGKITAVAQRHLHILFGGQLTEDGTALFDVSQALARALAWPCFLDFMTVDGNGSARHRNDAGKTFEQCRLAGTVGSQHDTDRAAFDTRIDPGDHR